MKQDERILKELKKNNLGFGPSLRKVREMKNISLRQMAKKVRKTSAYISDVERGNIKPPTQKLLCEILDALSLCEDEPLRDYFFDLAALQRGEVSQDISSYIMEHEEIRCVIRRAIRKEVNNEFWEKCAKIL